MVNKLLTILKTTSKARFVSLYHSKNWVLGSVPRIIFCLFFSVTSQSFAKNPTNLTIFSESNMAYAMTIIASEYSKENNVIISIDFNSSLELINNIDFGEPADVFISSHQDWIDILKQKGLVDVYNLSNITKDTLVLITSKNNTKIDSKEITNLDSNISEILKTIHRKGIPLIIDSEYTSLGRYTGKIIKTANIKNHRIFHKVSEDKKSIIDFINENEDYCGIVLASELKKEDHVKILAKIPNINIYYQGLVIAGDNMEEARNFLQYLKTPKSMNILTSAGFVN